jgi:hypothetical protein
VRGKHVAGKERKQFMDKGEFDTEVLKMEIFFLINQIIWK